MRKGRSWARLLETLGGFGGATEVGSGRIEVRLTATDSRRRIHLVITPEQWDELVDTPWGSIDDALAYVRQAVTDLDTHHRFLVFEINGLVASSTPGTPITPAELEARQSLRRQPAARGRWSTLDQYRNHVGWTP